MGVVHLDPEDDMATEQSGPVPVKGAPLVMAKHVLNEEGVAAGGVTGGPGFVVFWPGEVRRDAGDHTREGEFLEATQGAYLEDVLAACADRLRFHQETKFGCRENALALTHIETAILWLRERQRERRDRGVAGTSKP